MDWAAWRPTYESILADFGYDRAADEAARDELDTLLGPALAADLPSLAEALAGREAFVVGGAARAQDVDALPDDAPLLVADAAAALVVARRRPLAIVTDLDGDVGAQAAVNALGVPLVVHAHGDNRRALAQHVPRFRGPLLGTTQAEPRRRVRCFGGFTDGDRAVCLAAHLGAARIALVGFDFERPTPKPGADAQTKRRKLAWARRIIDGVGLPVRSV